MSSGALLTLASLLSLAAWNDARTYRIPNVLVGAIVIAGLVFSVGAGFSGFSAALAGVAIGLMAFLPLYLFSFVGAGDVKLLAATGAFTGLGAPWAIVATLIAGTVIGIALMIYRRFKVSKGSANRVPYAVAITAGVVGWTLVEMAG